MFTGIIESIGMIKKITTRGDDAFLEVETSMNLDDVKIGDSIAISGTCLTVTGITDGGFVADVSAETLEKTTLKRLQRGDRINLEKALRVDSFLGGHLVLGHVDGIGTVYERKVKSNSVIFGIEIDTALMRYVVEKGSVAVDGISLTVNRCEKKRFYINIIPHTASVTTLETKKVGDIVNIETDILGKYVEKLLHPEKEIDMALLREHGFLK